MRTELMNALILAYLGDAIFEVMVREYVVTEEKLVKPKDLQQRAIQFVSASAQRHFMEIALQKQWLTNSEIDTYKRGRNTKNGSKNETVDHSYSTGFEAIIGTLYLEDRKERLQEIFSLYKTTIR